MGKVLPDSGPSTPAQLRHSYQFLGTASTGKLEPKETAASSDAPKKGRRGRFVTPHRLSAEQSCQVLAWLKEQGIGDPEGRTLFVSALEYCLADLVPPSEAAPAPLPEPKAEAAKQSRMLDELASATETASKALEALEDPVRGQLLLGLESADCFERKYPSEYIGALCHELRRLKQACESMGQLQKGAENPTPSRRSDTAAERRFVLRAAEAFESCFELAADSRPDAQFVATLEAVAAATGAAVPTEPARLRRFLKHS